MNLSATLDDPLRTAPPFEGPRERQPIDEQTLRDRIEARLAPLFDRALQLDHNVGQIGSVYPDRAAALLNDCATSEVRDAFAALVRAAARPSRSQEPAIVLSLLNRWLTMAKQAALADLVAAELVGPRITFEARQ
ncbi:hypothetical protein BBB39_09080 [Bordetella trematum]|uniref:Uncharacterized protein n=1 Tax=Bordetella trematum TaxID=123899 RepID=A0A157QCK3_9BORD|nr:hypothetical protein [Bordetella trematum]AZR93906.1 hypothetical protein BBB39_09080 [Bordetella trematum]NNH19035.1 hypothetical protein [Bordetella trematum]SAI42809.1 Uncharacterised protein [Bordetella trematum]SAI72173.1 Uncharacterised protein [Bordetella trematum]SUV97949.1 Uncharacterised protein [Bordetella trematum]